MESTYYNLWKRILICYLLNHSSSCINRIYLEEEKKWWIRHLDKGGGGIFYAHNLNLRLLWVRSGWEIIFLGRINPFKIPKESMRKNPLKYNIVFILALDLKSRSSCWQSSDWHVRVIYCSLEIIFKRKFLSNSLRGLGTHEVL